MKNVLGRMFMQVFIHNIALLLPSSLFRIQKSLSSLPFALGNELDWPQLSLVTGYMDSIWDVAKGPTVSVYQNLLRRNRCNHRDYQNVAVNGKI